MRNSRIEGRLCNENEIAKTLIDFILKLQEQEVGVARAGLNILAPQIQTYFKFIVMSPKCRYKMEARTYYFCLGLILKHKYKILIETI